jgi:hypothetical protein
MWNSVKNKYLELEMETSFRTGMSIGTTRLVLGASVVVLVVVVGVVIAALV